MCYLPLWYAASETPLSSIEILDTRALLCETQYYNSFGLGSYGLRKKIM